MHDILLLTKIFLKNREVQNKRRVRSQSNLWGWILIYVYLAFCMCYISYDTTISLQTINNEALMIKIALIVAIMFIAMRSFFTVINYLYFSQDNEALIALPIKPYKLIAAKFLYLIVNEYFMIFATIAPLIITNGVIRGLEPSFYFLTVLICIILPIIPIVVVGTITTIVMRFTKFIRNKNVVQYLSVLLSIAICIFAVGISTQNQQITDYEMGQRIEAQTAAIDSTADRLLIVNPEYEVLCGNSVLKNCIIVVDASLGVFILGTFIVSLLFVPTVARCNSSGSQIRKGSKVTDKEFTGKSAWKSYLGKELKVLIRNPIFCFQCLLPVVLMPIMLTIGFLSNEQELLTELRNSNQELVNMLNSSLGLMIIILAGIFFFMFNYLSITAISREGKDSTFIKYIPVSLSKQAFYKIIFGVIVDIIISIYLILFIEFLIPGVSYKVLINASLLLLIINIYNNYIGIVRDLKKPKLGWTSEYEVIKRNLNMFHQTITTFAQIVLIGVTCAIISNAEIYTMVLFVIYTILTYLKIDYIRKNEKELLKNIY